MPDTYASTDPLLPVPTKGGQASLHRFRVDSHSGRLGSLLGSLGLTLDFLGVGQKRRQLGAATAVLQQIAINGNRVVALGQATNAAGTATPFAELSVDGGTAWQQVPFSSPGPDTAFTALTADSAGFTAAGLYGAAGPRNVAVWTSATGASWKPSQASGLGGAGAWEITALTRSGSVVTGIGSIATQQSQQTVTLTLPAR